MMVLNQKYDKSLIKEPKNIHVPAIVNTYCLPLFSLRCMFFSVKQFCFSIPPASN